MITGVGTDVVEIDRFRNLKDRAQFLEQVFTRTEIHNAPPGFTQATFYATLFAIKEALLKALGFGLTEGSLWREIQITRDWIPHLTGVLQRKAGQRLVGKIHVSHSHSERNAVAFVLIESTFGEEIL